ncbi:hypothetical protein Runsl_5687 (plasmid) [Runella slithyformis DSM 19594]|uniref:mannan endo-1,4-beta-mannosidase n=1 Tax=Runella slithyformis (strain ATCC 29530 / DSM 19594 / LMG 11500 / NCIMB 11436 / LSU 4) TaxID=761193 RepID=A0A7U3ZRE7_RUNSL|nr:hypothetical protein Runsl_5687 [Runella slithyformis DSM 19594]
MYVRKSVITLLCCFIGQCFAQKPPASDLFVQVNQKDARYLALSDGSTFIPIGANICFPRLISKETDVLAYYDHYFRQLAANGGNFTRIWLSVPLFEVENKEAGKYDVQQAERIDKVLALAKKYTIRVKFCLEHFRKITNSPAPFPSSVPFDRPVYAADIATMEDFFLTEKGKKRYLDRVDFFAKRYGNNPTVFGWELWNEVNAVNVKDKEMLLKWTQEMLVEVKKRLPRQLVMQTLGSFDSEAATELYRHYSQLPQNQLAQAHRYLDTGAALAICQAPMDELGSDAVRTLKRFSPDKPVILSEVGGVEPHHAGPLKLYEKDSLGILLHDLLFAPFFSGAAAPGQSWHWDYYLEKNSLWWHFGRFSEAVSRFDPVVEKAESFVDTLSNQLKLYGLRGTKTTLLWLRDGAVNWKTELAEGQPARVISGQQLTASLKNARKVSFYDPWENRWTQGTISPEGKINLPDFSRSLIVKLEK